MTWRGRPRRAFVLALLAACGAGASASTNTSSAPSEQPAASDDPAGSAPQEAANEERNQPEQPEQPGHCLVRSQRSFIGFSEGMSLDDFDLAAIEGKHVMKLTENTLCGQANALEPSGRLVADLAARRLTLFEVIFVRDDASAADIGLRHVDAPDDARGDYRVAAERTADLGWRIVGVTLR